MHGSSALPSVLFSFVCVLLFVPVVVVVVVVIVVMCLPTYFLIQVVYRRQGRTLAPLSFLHRFAVIKKSCDRNFAKSDIGYIKSKGGIVHP